MKKALLIILLLCIAIFFVINFEKIFRYLLLEKTEFVSGKTVLIDENIPNEVLASDAEFKRLRAINPNQTIEKTTLPNNVVVGAKRMFSSPNHQFILIEHNPDYGDWGYDLWNVSTNKFIAKFSLVESDPGSGRSWYVLFSKDSKEINFKGTTLDRKKKKSYGFDYIYIIESDKVYSLPNPGGGY